MFCPKCGSKIELDEQRYCHRCGFDLFKISDGLSPDIQAPVSPTDSIKDSQKSIAEENVAFASNTAKNISIESETSELHPGDLSFLEDLLIEQGKDALLQDLNSQRSSYLADSGITGEQRRARVNLVEREIRIIERVNFPWNWWAFFTLGFWAVTKGIYFRMFAEVYKIRYIWIPFVITSLLTLGGKGVPGVFILLSWLFYVMIICGMNGEKVYFEKYRKLTTGERLQDFT